ncbi:hypothetical protein R1flu_020356 [Riccia fluitans]|uniref:Reverse transcriptase zinc-binding domain-containing protein n=1 Tax=Riccia fluitans TaxID=41844 RepID=A0ABD1ZLC2_9MARC
MGEKTDWAQMMRFFIRQEMLKRSHGRETKFLMAEEGLILLPLLCILQSETMNNIILSWFRLRKFLILSDCPLDLPGSLTLRQVHLLLERYKPRRLFNDRIVYPILRRLGIRVLINLADSSGKWIEVANSLWSQGIQLNQVQAEAIKIFQEWLCSVRMGTQRLQDSTSWHWKGSADKWNGWTQTSKAWHNLLSVEETPDDLSTKWPEGEYALTWSERRRKLWEEGGLSCVKLWKWKVLRRAFFTGECAKTMKVASDPCCRCKVVEETVPHLFYECRDSQS